MVHLCYHIDLMGRQGVGWGFDCLCWPRVGHLTDLVLQGKGYSSDVEIFVCQLGRRRLRPNISFPLPHFTHAPYGLERSGNHGGQREKAKAEWISLF